MEENVMQKDHLGKSNGDLVATVKSSFQPPGTIPAIDASIFDGVTFVNMLKPDASNILNHYAWNVLSYLWVTAAGLYAELFFLPGVSKLRLEAEKEGESKGFPNP